MEYGADAGKFLQIEIPMNGSAYLPHSLLFNVK